MLLLAAVDQTIISTAMPKIVAQLGGFDRYAWATTAYLLTSTVSIPVFGRLVISRKKNLSAWRGRTFHHRFLLMCRGGFVRGVQLCLYRQHEPLIALAR